MSTNCSISSCKRVSYALCHGCRQNFCREHMLKHSESTQLQLKPLQDKIDQMNNVLNGINLENLYDTFYQQFDEWRRKSHQMIEIYFEEKVNHLDKYIKGKIERLNKDLDEIETKSSSYMHEQETTHEQIQLLRLDIRSLQRDINKIKNNDFQIQIYPLKIDQNLINFNELIVLPQLGPVYRVIDHKDENCCTSLATDGRHLLLHQQDTLLVVDEELSKYKQIPWTYGSI